MDIIFLLIPIALVLVGLIVWALMWAIKSGQFDDMEGPAHQILMEEDTLVDEAEHAAQSKKNTTPP
jgi:cbb3-type cytochrome oxidase maturation protein